MCGLCTRSRARGVLWPKKLGNSLHADRARGSCVFRSAATLRLGRGSIQLYDLRHTAVTLAVTAGVSVKIISDQLGHASISFTLERYSHVLPSIQDEAAAKVKRMLVGSTLGEA